MCVMLLLSSVCDADMRAERNMLARQVYPELRQRCAELDLDFQVVDLRWGLTSETQNDHSGTKVCLQEIKNCQDVSLGPNFVVSEIHIYLCLFSLHTRASTKLSFRAHWRVGRCHG